MAVVIVGKQVDHVFGVELVVDVDIEGTKAFSIPGQHLRPVAPGENTLACPCDGKISQSGAIQAGAIMQAKGRAYSVLELLGGDKAMAAEFANGCFSTIYLAPHDYHRLHMPLGFLLENSKFRDGLLILGCKEVFDF